MLTGAAGACAIAGSGTVAEGVAGLAIASGTVVIDGEVGASGGAAVAGSTGTLVSGEGIAGASLGGDAAAPGIAGVDGGVVCARAVLPSINAAVIARYFIGRLLGHSRKRAVQG